MWIRTTEDEVDGFTVRCIWPLCNPPKINLFYKINLWSWRRESNPQPADYKSAALPLSHASIKHTYKRRCLILVLINKMNTETLIEFMCVADSPCFWYTPKPKNKRKSWCLEPESNQWHKDFQSFALPTELSRQNGDLYETWTRDLQRDRLAL